ncbi:MAG TPA: META domain-containing protein [Hyphomicrobium sp.]|nr:META domain-containing protein [Hyphomicrobium sp.]
MTGRRAIFAITLLVIASAPTAHAADDLNGTWRAESALGGAVSGPELQITGVQVSGTGGCNRYSGTAVISKGAIKFGPLRATRMFCAGKMDTETVFLSALDAARAYRLSGNQLVLTDETGSPVATFTK